MPRRLFVIWTSPIFRDAVGLLLEHPEVDWVGMTSDYGAAGDTIFALRPDTVLVEEIEGSIPDSVMEILEKDDFDLRLIGVSLADNKLQVYQRERLAVVHADDLLQLVLQ